MLFQVRPRMGMGTGDFIGRGLLGDILFNFFGLVLFVYNLHTYVCYMFSSSKKTCTESLKKTKD